MGLSLELIDGAASCSNGKQAVVSLLKGSWDLVTRVIVRVTILITTYNPNEGTYNHTY